MRKITEFEIWSKPGGQLSPEYGKVFLREKMYLAGISEEAFIGLSEIPDDVDCERLEISFASNECSVDQFEGFCIKNNIIPDTCSPGAAAGFLEYMEGRCLAWVHIFEDSPPDELKKIIEISERLGHVVLDLNSKRISI